MHIPSRTVRNLYLSAWPRGRQGAGSTQPGPYDQTPPLLTRRPSSTRAAACKEIPATLAPTPSTTPTTSAPQVSLKSRVMVALSRCTPRLLRHRRWSVRTPASTSSEMARGTSKTATARMGTSVLTATSATWAPTAAIAVRGSTCRHCHRLRLRQCHPRPRRLR